LPSDWQTKPPLPVVVVNIVVLVLAGGEAVGKEAGIVVVIDGSLSINNSNFLT